MFSPHQFALERLDKWLSPIYWCDINLRSVLERRKAPIAEIWAFEPGDSVHPNIRQVLAADPARIFTRKVSTGATFGPIWSTKWFKLIVRETDKIISSWDTCIDGDEHENISSAWALIWDSDSEAMLYSAAGEPLQAFTGGGGADRRDTYVFRARDLLPSHPQVDGSSSIVFYVEMACNGMAGNGTGGMISAPKVGRTFTLAQADLVELNMHGHRLFWDMQVLFDLARKMPESNPICTSAITLATRIMDEVDLKDDRSLAAQHARASTFFGRRNGSSVASIDTSNHINSGIIVTNKMDHSVYALGHCHIDTAWLWPYRETKRKILRSWVTQLALMERYSDSGSNCSCVEGGPTAKKFNSKFVASQAVQWEWLRDDHPAVYERVLSHVALNNSATAGKLGTTDDGMKASPFIDHDRVNPLSDSSGGVTAAATVGEGGECGKGGGSGRFLPVGASYVEFDANIPSGESMIRQLLYGLQYFQHHVFRPAQQMQLQRELQTGTLSSQQASDKEKSRKSVQKYVPMPGMRVFWLPDTFGYSGQLPQILRGCGMEYFLSQKLSWNLTNRFPHTTFHWEGIDGTAVIAHFPPADNYNSLADTADVMKTVENHGYSSRGVSNRSLLLFGHGDGGGGPGISHFEHLLRLQNCPGLPKILIDTDPEAFFDAVRDEDNAQEVSVSNQLQQQQGVVGRERGHERGSKDVALTSHTTASSSPHLLQQVRKAALQREIHAGTESRNNGTIAGKKRALLRQSHKSREDKPHLSYPSHCLPPPYHHHHHHQRTQSRLPTWVGELYLELHQGTLTSQALVKALNRRCEDALRVVEGLVVAVMFLDFQPSAIAQILPFSVANTSKLETDMDQQGFAAVDIAGVIGTEKRRAGTMQRGWAEAEAEAVVGPAGVSRQGVTPGVTQKGGILEEDMAAAQRANKRIKILWKDVMLNQFHDVIPGTSIGMVYEDTHRMLTHVLSSFSHIQNELTTILTRRISCAMNNPLENTTPCTFMEGVVNRRPTTDGVMTLDEPSLKTEVVHLSYNPLSFPRFQKWCALPSSTSFYPPPSPLSSSSFATAAATATISTDSAVSEGTSGSDSAVREEKPVLLPTMALGGFGFNALVKHSSSSLSLPSSSSSPSPPPFTPLPSCVNLVLCGTPFEALDRFAAIPATTVPTPTADSRNLPTEPASTSTSAPTHVHAPTGFSSTPSEGVSGTVLRHIVQSNAAEEVDEEAKETYKKMETEKGSESERVNEYFCLENAYLRVVVDSVGQLRSVLDKRLHPARGVLLPTNQAVAPTQHRGKNRGGDLEGEAMYLMEEEEGEVEEALAGCGNRLMIYDDVPFYWDAWDVFPYHTQRGRSLQKSLVDRKKENDQAVTAKGRNETCENDIKKQRRTQDVLPHEEEEFTMPREGKEVETRRAVSTFSKKARLVHSIDGSSVSVIIELTDWSDCGSTLRQAIVLRAESSLVEFETEVDWRESHKLLKVEFPLAIRTRAASYDIQCGLQERPTHSNTPFDAAMHEVCGHKYADLSEGSYGVALLNDCKYGYSCRDGSVLCLSLLRSPKAPDAECDMRVHRFRYALMPHLGGSPLEGNVPMASFLFNVPVAVSSSSSVSSISSSSPSSSAMTAVVAPTVPGVSERAMSIAESSSSLPSSAAAVTTNAAAAAMKAFVCGERSTITITGMQNPHSSLCSTSRSFSTHSEKWSFVSFPGLFEAQCDARMQGGLYIDAMKLAEAWFDESGNEVLFDNIFPPVSLSSSPPSAASARDSVAAASASADQTDIDTHLVSPQAVDSVTTNGDGFHEHRTRRDIILRLVEGAGGRGTAVISSAVVLSVVQLCDMRELPVRALTVTSFSSSSSSSSSRCNITGGIRSGCGRSQFSVPFTPFQILTFRCTVACE